MPTQITNYQCPACTGPLHFVGESGKLECEYCGAAYAVSEIEAMYAEKEQKACEAAERDAQKPHADWNFDDAGGDWGGEADGMKAYNCPSCGAELICDETTAATSCPYCGNPTVVPGQFGGTLKPDYIIPFKLDKQAAVAALKKHYRGKLFLPRSFSAGNHIDEVKGVYVPFWLFDGEADADITFHATRSYTHREGDYRVTTTEHFEVHRAGTVTFEKIPVDASTKMPDDHMDSIEPYDYTELKPFSTAYLPGYLADKYDVCAADSAQRAENRTVRSTIDCLQATVHGYETCIPEWQDVNLRRGQVKYALMPVWLLCTKWQGKNFLFAMNGQTGRLVGDLPVSWGRFWGLFAAIAAPLAALLALVMFL